jgi:tetratricopeptide (TPR) repeat protein
MTIKGFVGRHAELARIEDWLQRPGGRLILITGVGGVGKTSLLQKIKEEYSKSDRFVVEYFDLAEQPVAMINQAVHLARSIGLENFPRFRRAINDLAEPTDELDQTYEKQMNDAVDICLQEATVYLQVCRKRLLLITDTFEIALKYDMYEDRRVKKTYERLVRRLPGTCFIMAGRDKADDVSVVKEAYPLMQELFGAANILHMPLSGFNENEIQYFFAEMDRHQMIPQEMREKLYLLTGGRPILLSLAVDWLQKKIPLPIMIEKSQQELRELVKSEDRRKELLNSFEFELVSRVRQLETPLDIAILYMAQVDRRTDAQMLSILLNMGATQAEDLMKSLMDLSFVKEFVGSIPPKCTLHDEMVVLVNKYAWEFLDISGEERKRLTQKVVEQYYLPRIDSIKQGKQDLLKLDSQATLLQNIQSTESDWERWLLEAEALYYWLKVSKEAGYAYFDDLYYDKEKSEIRDQFLIDELQRAGVYDEEKIGLRDADDLRRHGKNEEARRKCLTVLSRKDLSVSDQIHAHNILGLIDSESAPLAAEKNFQKALELAESVNDQRVQSIIHNNLGRLYRNTSRLEKSISYYRKALELAKLSNNSETISTARNNLAWTYRLDGNLVDADALCRFAITENRKRGHERPLAYAYLTKADIDRDRGDLQNAERHANQALDIFSRLEDTEGKAQAYRTLANISRYLQNFERALRYLRAGILLVEKRSSYQLLASLYQLYGRSVRHYATYLQTRGESSPENIDNQLRAEQSELFEDALLALQKSIELAEQIGNPWEIARSQLEIILIMMLQPEKYNETKLNELLEKVRQTADELNDELLMGYVYENRGRMEMRKKKYLESGRAFGEAARYIAKRTGQETTRAFDRLHNILLDDPLTNEDRDALAKGVLEQLTQQDSEDRPALSALADTCKEILASPI